MKIYRVNWWNKASTFDMKITTEQGGSAHFSNRKEAVKFRNKIRGAPELERLWREFKVEFKSDIGSVETGALDEIDILEIKMPITRSELIDRLNFAGNSIGTGMD